MTKPPNNSAVDDDISEACSTVLAASDDARVLIISDGSSRAPDAEARITRRDGLDDLENLDGSGRFELAIVRTDSAVIADEQTLSQLLAALRDRFARRVLVLDQRQAMSLNDYLALGFERMPGAATDRQFLFDPDAESRQREWNNARNWANPENFERYRW